MDEMEELLPQKNDNVKSLLVGECVHKLKKIFLLTDLLLSSIALQKAADSTVHERTVSVRPSL